MPTLGSSDKTVPLVTRLTVTNSGETTHALPTLCKAFTIRAIDHADFRVSYQTGEVNDDAGDWLIVRDGECYWEDHLWPGPVTLYLRADDSAGNIAVSIVEWTSGSFIAY